MSAGPFCQRKFTFTLLGRPACYLSRPPIFSPMTELGLKRRVQKGEIGRSLKWVQFRSFGPSIFTDRSFSQTVHFQSFGPPSLMYDRSFSVVWTVQVNTHGPGTVHFEPRPSTLDLAPMTAFFDPFL